MFRLKLHESLLILIFKCLLLFLYLLSTHYVISHTIVECFLNHFGFSIQFIQNLTINFLELLFFLTNFTLTAFVSLLQSLLYLRKFSLCLLVRLSKLLCCEFVFKIKNFAAISMKVDLRLTHWISHTTTCGSRSKKCIFFVRISCWCLRKSFCSISIILVYFLCTF